MTEESDKPEPGDGAAGEDVADGDDRECAGDEFVIPGPPTSDGGRMCMFHGADHSTKMGVMRPLEDGKPIREDAVLLERREGTPYFDVVGSVTDLRKGPSKVVTNAYRKGWDAVFGGKPDPKAN